MKKIVIATDSFKGSLLAKEINSLYLGETKKYKDSFIFDDVLLSDGGEGMLDSIANSQIGKFINLSTFGPNLNKINGRYFLNNENVAFIESSDAIGYNKGLYLAGDRASSCGLGLEISDAILNGAKKIVIGLGGSATCDMGVGMAYALGVKFYDSNDNEFLPVGESLNKIIRIDDTGAKNLLKDIEIICLSDVDIKLLGKEGAVYVFGPQKNVKNLEKTEENFNYLVNLLDAKKTANKKGAGAAGGIGFACLFLLNASIVSGSKYILEQIKFDEIIQDANYIITGEGKFDKTSLKGKILSAIIEQGTKYNIPLIGVFGSIDDDIDVSLFTKTYLINDPKLSLEKNIKKSKEHYKKTISVILNDLKNR